MTFLVVFFKVCEFLYDVFENFENFAKKMSIYDVIYGHPTLYVAISGVASLRLGFCNAVASSTLLCV